MDLQFLGATDTVIGSKYLLRAGAATVLVDCGLFQGYKQLRLRNWTPLPVAPGTIDALVLAHAHIDSITSAEVFLDTEEFGYVLNVSSL